MTIHFVAANGFAIPITFKERIPMKTIHEGTLAPIKMWTDFVPVEDQAMLQLKNIANLPFIYKHVAAMPDVHWGMGATVGSVIATKGAVCPAAVGVDIGCGMMAVKTNIIANQLPDNLHAIRCDIEKAVPHGRTNNGAKGDRGAWFNTPDFMGEKWKELFQDRYNAITARHPGAKAHNTTNHLGTLGGGNHFVEVCVDTEQNVWVMLHSGSRGLGNKIGTYFIEKATKECEKESLPDKDLSYLVEGTDLFNDYVQAVELAQEFAFLNRAVMMQNTLAAIRLHIPHLEVTDTAVNCHHNYISRENHFDHNVIVTRKGAVRARATDLGIIPGSMGAKSFIVRGKGNPESFCSCSHGAGRVMSRRKAKDMITLEQHIADTQGVECRKDKDVIDESPKAYKNIDDVMRSQEDLVEIVATLKQVLCVKG